VRSVLKDLPERKSESSHEDGVLNRRDQLIALVSVP
jgi:hypothetical protein